MAKEKSIIYKAEVKEKKVIKEKSKEDIKIEKKVEVKRNEIDIKNELKDKNVEVKVEAKEIIEDKKGKSNEASDSVTDSDKVEKKEERAGIAYIFSSPNNTIVHITDLAGNTISRVSGGMVTKHSRLKADPTIAMFVAKKAAERAKDLGINALFIRM